MFIVRTTLYMALLSERYVVIGWSYKHAAPMEQRVKRWMKSIPQLIQCGTRRARSLGPHGPKLLRK